MTPRSRPTPFAQAKRQQIVTQVVTQSSAPTATANNGSKGFPVAVAIPALVGGMAVAIVGFLIFWWMSKRKRREKRERWERHQRRMARKRENASGRPSLSSSHHGHSSAKIVSEKSTVPPVPELPKQPVSSYQVPSETYNYEPKEPINQEQNYYAQQPAIEQDQEPMTDEQGLPKRPSRSAARAAAAEQAAESSFGDPNTRYQPKKPSPLALKAAADKQNALASSQRGGSLEPESRQSGEWGVALGSQAADTASYQAQVPSNDPYIQGFRGKSGMYSHDPYAAYHGDQVEEVDYHAAAADQGLGKGRNNWV